MYLSSTSRPISRARCSVETGVGDTSVIIPVPHQPFGNPDPFRLLLLLVGVGECLLLLLRAHRCFPVLSVQIPSFVIARSDEQQGTVYAMQYTGRHTPIEHLGQASPTVAGHRNQIRTFAFGGLCDRFHG